MKAVARGLSYAEAVKILSGRDDRIMSALDKLASGALLTASATGVTFALSLFDPKSDLVRLSRGLVENLAEKLGRNRAGRTERLVAAHTMIVMTAYVEALQEARLPFNIRKLKLSTDKDLVRQFLHTPLSPPTPQRPYEAVHQSLTVVYTSIADHVLEYLRALAVWDDLDETKRGRTTETIRRDAVNRALVRYDQHFRRLAAQFPEFAFWANLVNHQATRTQLTTGLAGLQKALDAIAAGQPPTDLRANLAHAYQSALSRPILPATDVPTGIHLPTLGTAYVNPDFRVADATGHLAEEKWWGEQPVRNDLQNFLVGHLTSPQATEAPLLVLGQPGSGKSVLTQIVAARLHASEFLTVRVVLREVPADTDLQDQIERSIRTATGETLTWPRLVKTAGDALPVVLLDGFDELLQATGVSQSDYLEKVAAFQQREADQGRPVAVVVTSRISVADRARAPRGTVAIRLEPFREDQIKQWVTTWNAINPPIHMLNQVSAYPELARQPLLLLMLALFDATGPERQRDDGSFRELDLYEGLLTQFAEREVRKDGADLSDEQCAHAVDQELLRLSVVALAMFNRRRQWVTAAELDADLAALLGPSEPRSAGMRAALTEGQMVVGRFFFIHQAQAVQDNERLATYEFLHATFGEYLVARLVARELHDLVNTAQLNRTRTRPTAVEDDFLHALLSFAPLTLRGTTLTFLKDLLPDQAELRDLLLPLFRESLEFRRPGRYDDYRPIRASAPVRHANYAVNLFLCLTLLDDITTDDLFPNSSDPIDEWRQVAQLWQSQLPNEAWLELVHTVALRRTWHDDRRGVVFRRGSTFLYVNDPAWSAGEPPASSSSRHGWKKQSMSTLQTQYQFLCDPGTDLLMHGFEPFGELGAAVPTVFDFWGTGAHSAANALIALYIASGRAAAPGKLSEAHLLCLRHAVYGFAPGDDEPRLIFRELYLRQLSVDWPRLSGEFHGEFLDILELSNDTGGKNLLEFRELANEIVPGSVSPPVRTAIEPGHATPPAIAD